MDAYDSESQPTYGRTSAPVEGKDYTDSCPQATTYAVSIVELKLIRI